MTEADDSSDPKSQAIVLAARDVFACYGFRKTSMEDVARAAGMSRPALYQYFKNKEAIAQALTRAYIDGVCARAQLALGQAGAAPEQVLEQLYRAKLLDFIEVSHTPHGHELIELGHAVSSDILQEGQARLNAGLATWLEQERSAGHIQFQISSRDMAVLLLQAVEGLKKPPFDRLEEQLLALAALMGRGLRS